MFNRRTSGVLTRNVDIVGLDLNRPSFNTPPTMHSTVHRRCSNQTLPCATTVNLPRLHRTVTSFCRRHRSLSVSPGHVYMATNNSTTLLLTATLAISPNSSIVITSPSCPYGHRLIHSFRNRIVSIPASTTAHFRLATSLYDRC